MNALLREHFPGHPFQEDGGAGVPRMRTETLPGEAELIDCRTALEMAAYHYRQRHHTPLPVFIGIGPGRKPAEWMWDINYVDCYSDMSISEAMRHVHRGRLRAEII